MTTVKFKDKDVNLVLNWYALREFGRAVDADTPAQSFDKVRKVLSSFKDDIPYETMDVIANLFYFMHRTSCELNGEEMKFKKAEAYDVITSLEAFDGMIKEINNFFPSPETVKKKQVKVAAKLT